MDSFVEWLKKNKFVCEDGRDCMPPINDNEEAITVRALGEWAWGKVIEYHEVGNYRAKELYWGIAVACLGKQKVEKRLQGEKRNG